MTAARDKRLCCARDSAALRAAAAAFLVESACLACWLESARSAAVRSRRSRDAPRSTADMPSLISLFAILPVSKNGWHLGRLCSSQCAQIHNLPIILCRFLNQDSLVQDQPFTDFPREDF